MGQEERDQQLKALQNGCFCPEQHKMYHCILQECDCLQDYGSMVHSWGYKVLVMETIGDWQGDYLVLLQDGERYGYVSISYGSCSGCDAMEACGSWDEVRELSRGLKNAIYWRSGQEMLDWFNDRDWETKIEHCLDGGGVKKFLEEAKKCVKI
jgi:hypothetical protein